MTEEEKYVKSLEIAVSMIGETRTTRIILNRKEAKEIFRRYTELAMVIKRHIDNIR